MRGNIFTAFLSQIFLYVFFVTPGLYVPARGLLYSSTFIYPLGELISLFYISSQKKILFF